MASTALRVEFISWGEWRLRADGEPDTVPVQSSIARDPRLLVRIGSLIAHDWTWIAGDRRLIGSDAG